MDPLHGAGDFQSCQSADHPPRPRKPQEVSPHDEAGGPQDEASPLQSAAQEIGTAVRSLQRLGGTQMNADSCMHLAYQLWRDLRLTQNSVSGVGRISGVLHAPRERETSPGLGDFTAEELAQAFEASGLSPILVEKALELWRRDRSHGKIKESR